MIVAIGRLTDQPANRPISSEPPARAFVVAFAGCVLVVAYLIKDVFLFSDDYVFFGQAAELPFGISYLGADLFGHFSPVSRLVDWLLVGVVPAFPGVVFLVLLVFVAGAQGAC